MNTLLSKSLSGLRMFKHRCAVALFFVAALSAESVAVDDVLLQTSSGRIVTGIVDDTNFAGTLGTRVYRAHFLSNFRSANPGFVALPSGSPGLPPGVTGFPSNHGVNFDLLPMTIDCVASNLFYWDGSDRGDEGFDLSDVAFGVSTEVRWEVFDANFDLFAVDGSDQVVPGGLIARTSADVDPSDGIDTGMIHKHLVLQLTGGSAAPAEGVYLVAWQARSNGFETSDPFFFVHRTPTIPEEVRDLAADWVEANIEMLMMPAGLPGDYNCDGAVDAADYVVWRRTFGQTGSRLAAHGNGNLEIDHDDYVIWRANFWTAATQTNAAASLVPEPATGMSLMFPALGVIAGCWRYRRPSLVR